MPGKPKRPETIDGYRNLGIRLAILRDLLGDVAVKIGHNFPKTYAYRILTGQKKIDEVRSDLEDLMFEQFPDESDTNIFYPSHEDRNLSTLLEDLTFDLKYEKK